MGKVIFKFLWKICLTPHFKTTEEEQKKKNKQKQQQFRKDLFKITAPAEEN